MRTLTRPGLHRTTVPTQRTVAAPLGDGATGVGAERARPAQHRAPEVPLAPRFRYRRLLAVGASALAAGGIALGAFLILDDDGGTAVAPARTTVTDTGRDGGPDVLEQRILDSQRAANDIARTGRQQITVTP